MQGCDVDDQDQRFTPAPEEKKLSDISQVKSVSSDVLIGHNIYQCCTVVQNHFRRNCPFLVAKPRPKSTVNVNSSSPQRKKVPLAEQLIRESNQENGDS
jgi:hypothetical protein